MALKNVSLLMGWICKERERKEREREADMWRVEWNSWKAHSSPEVLTTMSDVGKVPEWNYWNN